MKKIVLFLLTLAPVALFAQNSFTITGSLKYKPVASPYIYMEYPVEGKYILDSAKITGNGYIFKGTIDKPTEATLIDASEGTFQFGNGQTYSPRNFDANESTGMVTARQALAHSINTATVRVAEMVGYDKVVELAKAAGARVSVI